jgi:hypothetical protein
MYEINQSDRSYNSLLFDSKEGTIARELCLSSRLNFLFSFAATTHGLTICFLLLTFVFDNLILKSDPDFTESR